VGDTLKEKAVDELASEPDPHPSARHSVGVQPLGHAIVEGTVEVRERYVDAHARHRQ
jgi:hypothetical protein